MNKATQDVCVVWGSSRTDGNTKRSVDQLTHGRNCEIINLTLKTIYPYDYEYKNQQDDFLAVVNIIQNAQTVVFCTPV